MTTLKDVGGVLGRPLDTIFLGSHNFMEMALGLCMRWPWVAVPIFHSHTRSSYIEVTTGKHVKKYG